MVYKSLIKPMLLGWYHVFKRTFTVKYPYYTVLPAPNYRGRHYLELLGCIGCKLCARACPNQCIEMIKIEPPPEGAVKGTGLYPQIDYGRCCFCSLCVEACPKNVLHNTGEYRLVYRRREDFIFTPWMLSKPPDLSTLGKPVEPKIFRRRGAGHVKMSLEESSDRGN